MCGQQKCKIQITRNLRQPIGERLRSVQLAHMCVGPTCARMHAHTNRQPENIVAKMPGVVYFGLLLILTEVEVAESEKRVAAIFLLPVWALEPPKRSILPYSGSYGLRDRLISRVLPTTRKYFKSGSHQLQWANVIILPRQSRKGTRYTP